MKIRSGFVSNSSSSSFMIYGISVSEYELKRALNITTGGYWEAIEKMSRLGLGLDASAPEGVNNIILGVNFGSLEDGIVSFDPEEYKDKVTESLKKLGFESRLKVYACYYYDG